MYRLGNQTIIRIEDNAHIPIEDDNVDYQAYLIWVAEGNVPEPETMLAPVTPSVDAWQIRTALNQIGLRDQVEAAIAASTDIYLKDAWEYAPSFKRDHPLVISMGLALGKTEEELDALFSLALSL